jgi:hypothetical protein
MPWPATLIPEVRMSIGTRSVFVTIFAVVIALAMSLVFVSIRADVAVNWTAVGAIGTWIAAGVGGYITYLVWRANKRLTWLTGSMEAYQMKQLQLEASKHPDIKLIWWDPEIEPWPHTGAHGEEVKTTKIYLGIPLTHRKGTHTINRDVL